MKIFIALSLMLLHQCSVFAEITSYTLPAGSNEAFSLSLSPNGWFLVTANDSNDITLFFVSDSKLEQGTSYPVAGCEFTSSLAAVAFSPDSRYVAVASWGGDAVIIFKMQGDSLTEPKAYPLSGSRPVSVAFSADGLYLATANLNSNDVTLFKVTNGVLSNSRSYSLPSGSYGLSSIVFSPDGSCLATANPNSNNITVFQMTNGTLKNATSYATGSSAMSLAFSPDSRFLMTADRGSNSITVFSVKDGVLIDGPSYPLPSGSNGPNSLAFSQDGHVLATANDLSNDITLFDVSDNVLSNGKSYSGFGSAFSIAISPNNTYIAVADLDSNTVTIMS